jgi:hypothetical protein
MLVARVTIILPFCSFGNSIFCAAFCIHIRDSCFMIAYGRDREASTG